MDLREERLEDVVVLEARGRVDSTTAATLGEQLSRNLDSGTRRLVLDLKGLDYISSAGFRVLLVAAKRADAAGIRFVLSGVLGKVHQLFDIAGFLDLFPIYPSREAAVAGARQSDQ